MDSRLYYQYLQEYINRARQDSDGTARGMYESLAEIQVRGLLVSHKDERKRALADARKAFDEHRHWPVEIILKHLGVE